MSGGAEDFEALVDAAVAARIAHDAARASMVVARDRAARAAGVSDRAWQQASRARPEGMTARGLLDLVVQRANAEYQP